MRRLPRRQRGIVLVLVLTLVVAAALWGLTSSFGTAAQRADRDRATMAAIMQAKEALIAYSARGNLLLPSPPTIDRPGSLPCPATTTSGSAGIACTAFGPAQPNAMVGRFPWRTVGLPELRDASGEPLWYAISPNFRRVSGLVVNSETQGQLELVGIAPAQRVVAVIIAPGAPRAGQNRDPAVPASLVNVANYLEGENNYTDPAFDNGLNNYRFTNATPSETFNDIVVPITEAELFSVVENMVALRLRRDVKPLIDTEYRDFWGAYPFPDAAFDPTKTSFFQSTGTPREGHLPISAPSGDPAEVKFPWTSISVAGPTWNFVSPPTCSVTAPGNEAVCNTSPLINPNAVLTVQLAASNVGRSFAKWDNALVTVEEQDSSIPSTTTGPATIVGTPTGTVNSAGDGTVTVSVRLPTASPTVTYRVRYPRPQVNPMIVANPPATPSTAGNAAFFFDNEWYRLVLYAASRGALPGGAQACEPNPPASPSPCVLLGAASCPWSPPSCVTRVNSNGTRDNVGVVLVLAGRAMNVGGSVQARPASYISNPTDYLSKYLESASDPTLPLTSPREFTQKPRTIDPSTGDFNDRVVLLAP